jgi:hypothetical protein
MLLSNAAVLGVLGVYWLAMAALAVTAYELWGR